MREEIFWVHDDEGALLEEWSTGHVAGWLWLWLWLWLCLEASAARAASSQASRVLWSTGQADSALSAMAFISVVAAVVLYYIITRVGVGVCTMLELKS